METPDTRTHGAESAINDEAPPAQPFPAYEQFDAVDPIPGAEAIPADMPNAQPGDVSLPYDLQTFNALVAANTAMQTEISSLNEKAALIEQQRDSFKESLVEERANTKIYLAQIKDLQSAHGEMSKRFDEKMAEKDADIQFAKDQRDTLQRRLDRALGYLDRTLDEEDALRAVDTTVERAPRPPVGPSLGMIPDAVRRDKHGRTDMDFAYAATDLASPREMQAARRRRYG